MWDFTLGLAIEPCSLPNCTSSPPTERALLLPLVHLSELLGVAPSAVVRWFKSQKKHYRIESMWVKRWSSRPQNIWLQVADDGLAEGARGREVALPCPSGGGLCGQVRGFLFAQKQTKHFPSSCCGRRGVTRAGGKRRLTKCVTVQLKKNNKPQIHHICFLSEFVFNLIFHTSWKRQLLFSSCLCYLFF